MCRYSQTPINGTSWPYDPSIEMVCSQSGLGSYICPNNEYCGNNNEHPNINIADDDIIGLRTWWTPIYQSLAPLTASWLSLWASSSSWTWYWPWSSSLFWRLKNMSSNMRSKLSMTMRQICSTWKQLTQWLQNLQFTALCKKAGALPTYNYKDSSLHRGLESDIWQRKSQKAFMMKPVISPFS